jgi:hypothetical protein
MTFCPRTSRMSSSSFGTSANCFLFATRDNSSLDFCLAMPGKTDGGWRMADGERD